MNKSLLGLLGVLVLLGGYYLLGPKVPQSSQIRHLELPEISINFVDRIIVDDQNRIELQKESNVWWVQFFDDRGETKKVRASESMVQKMVNALNKVHASYVVSESADEHDNYGLAQDADSGVRVYVKGSLIWNLRVGKSKGLNKYYARKYEEDTVFSVQGDFSSIMLGSPNKYRRAQLLDLPSFEIIGMDYAAPRRKIGLRKEKGRWVLKKNRSDFRLSHDKVRTVLSRMASIRAFDFIDSPQLIKEVTSRKASLTLQIENGQKDIFKLRFFTLDKKEVAIQRPDTKELLVITQADFETIDPQMEGFRALNLTDLKFEDVHEISIEKGSESLLLPMDETSFSESEEALLRQIIALTAKNRVLKKSAEKFLEKKLGTVVLKGPHLKKYELRFWYPAYRRNRIWVQSSIDSHIYEIDEETADSLFDLESLTEN